MIQRCSLGLAIMTLLCVGDLAAADDDVTFLVRNGVSCGRIYLPRTFGRATMLAAHELQTYIGKATGAKLPIDFGTPETRRKRVVRPGEGRLVLETRIDPSAEISADGSEDVFRLQQAGDTVTISGNSDTATLYGAYQFLGDLGVRWFLPGEIGEHVPALTNIPITPFEREFTPAFRTREIDLSGTPRTHFASEDFDRLIPEHSMWILRNRCLYARNVHRDRRPACNNGRERTGHFLTQLLRGVSIDDEPERFPLVTRGNETKRLARGGQICFTHPANVKAAIDHALTWFAANPTMLTCSMSLADHGGICECTGCVAANAGAFPPLEPDRVVWLFMNQVIRGIRAQLPQKRIAFYSCYGSLKAPPENMKIEDGIVAITANVGANNVRIDDPNDPFAGVYLAQVQQTKRAGVELGAREYTMFGGIPQPLPLLEQVKIYHDLGYAYYHCESMGRDEIRTVIQWVQAQLLWDADRDPMALLAEACNTLYGAAGPDVLAVIKLLDARTRRLPRLIFGSHGVMQWVVSDEIAAAGDRRLAKGRAAVTGRQAERLQRLTDTFGMFARRARYARAGYEAMDQRTETKRQRAIRLVDEFRTFWKEHDLDETCSASILGGALKFRKILETMPLAIEPKPRKGFAEPSDNDRLAALFSLDTPPATLESLHYLPDVWKFKLDIHRRAQANQWQAPEFDDTGWRELSVYNFYERQGFDLYDGSFCYRTRFTAPAYPAGRKVFLRIGSLDDEGKIYLNGQLLHERWHLVARDWKRSFEIDVTAAVRRGQQNTIAIIGNDEYGVGGLWNPCALYMKKADQ